MKTVRISLQDCTLSATLVFTGSSACSSAPNGVCGCFCLSSRRAAGQSWDKVGYIANEIEVKYIYMI
nr:MAG TPA: hypothetical protein [Microviridae sp.]